MAQGYAADVSIGGASATKARDIEDARAALSGFGQSSDDMRRG
jgi:hypothetical protein